MIRLTYTHNLKSYDIKGYVTLSSHTRIIMKRKGVWYSVNALVKKGVVTVDAQTPLPLSARPKYKKYKLPLVYRDKEGIIHE